MNKRLPMIIAVMLLLSIINYTRLSHNDTVRPIQFLSIFVIGALSGLLLQQIFGRIFNRPR